jgi:hypothetical protein
METDFYNIFGPFLYEETGNLVYEVYYNRFFIQNEIDVYAGSNFNEIFPHRDFVKFPIVAPFSFYVLPTDLPYYSEVYRT